MMLKNCRKNHFFLYGCIALFIAALIILSGVLPYIDHDCSGTRCFVCTIASAFGALLCAVVGSAFRSELLRYCSNSDNKRKIEIVPCNLVSLCVKLSD